MVHDVAGELRRIELAGGDEEVVDGLLGLDPENDRELALVDIAEQARQGADEVIADLTPTAERVGGRIAQTAVRRAAGLLSRLGLHAEVPPEIDALSDRLTRGAVRRGAEALRAKLKR